MIVKVTACMQPQCGHAPGTVCRDTDEQPTQATQYEILWYKLLKKELLAKQGEAVSTDLTNGICCGS